MLKRFLRCFLPSASLIHVLLCYCVVVFKYKIYFFGLFWCWIPWTCLPPGSYLVCLFFLVCHQVEYKTVKSLCKFCLVHYSLFLPQLTVTNVITLMAIVIHCHNYRRSFNEVVYNVAWYIKLRKDVMNGYTTSPRFILQMNQ